VTKLIGRAWVPMVMVVVVAVGAFNAQFKPKRVICEVYGPRPRLAAGALRCWSGPATDAGDRPVTDRLAKGI
jgi:hypothetical protein